MEIVVVLDNIRSTYNVGAILRTVEGLGVKRVIFSGYTPFPGIGSGRLPHVSEKEAVAIAKTALGAEKLLELSYSLDITKTLDGLKSGGYMLIGLENNVKDERLHQLSEPGIDKALEGKKLVLVLGEEVHGIGADILKKLDCLLEIPMRGKKESFNVSVAAGIALYELTK
ncbi:TrmH family RNA methyltransferase [Candidatus Saccharibacteria bacterium]|nr:TrmH family RNA methyltransferase [Candidatus Saccharibacteria bacterium]